MMVDSIDSELVNMLRSRIRNIPDFPVKGIQFKDITPLLSDPHTLELTARLLRKPFNGHRVDFVVGLEARGFFFGPRLAADLMAGFVPVRKPMKLPFTTISANYDLEYGTDSLEMHADAITENSNVIIHDDLIATGGSALAATDLVERMGARVVGYSFVLGLSDLNGTIRLNKKGTIIDTLIKL
ncbi:MAG: adenine phosphoribosyltransferase [Balneolales bacterium]